MFLYGRDQCKKEIKPIDLSSIQFVSTQLSRLIYIYTHYINLRKQSDIDTLNQLIQYNEILKSGRYDMLINDTSVIHVDIDAEDIDSCT